MGSGDGRWRLRGPPRRGGECVRSHEAGPCFSIRQEPTLLIDGWGLPLGLIYTASPSEVRLFEPLLDNHVLGQHAPRLIYYRTADSDPLRIRLAKDGIQLILSYRKCRRKRHPSQDGRVLKRYRQRRKVEPTIAWWAIISRLLTRFERYPRLFIAFAQLASLHRCLHRLIPL